MLRFSTQPTNEDIPGPDAPARSLNLVYGKPNDINELKSNNRLYRNNYVELHKHDKSHSSAAFTKHFITSNDLLNI